MTKTYTRAYFVRQGAIGGRKSTRNLTTSEAKAMSIKGVEARRVKRLQNKSTLPVDKPQGLMIN